MKNPRDEGSPIGLAINEQRTEQLARFVQRQRALRGSKEWQTTSRKAKDQTVAQIARDLGVDKDAVLGKIEEYFDKEPQND